MSLEFIGESDRNRLRVHGALLLLWSVLVGIASSAVLLHVFQVHSMAVRYALGAAAVYFLGFLGGGWCYAAWWNQLRDRKRPLPTHAAPNEQKSHEELRAQRRKSLSSHLLLELNGVIGGLVNLLAHLFTWFLLIALVVASFHYLLRYFPVVAVDTVAGYLADVVLEFVIGASVIQKIMKPRALDEYWPVMIKKTWITGCLLVAAAGVTGFLIQYWKPGAETVFQALR
jgi:hypothetical protein